MALVNNDWDTLIRKLDSLEEKIDRLDKEIYNVNKYIDTQLRSKYHPYQSDDPNAPYYRSPYTAYQGTDKLRTSCIFDSIPPEDRMKPMGLSCNCPKCTPYSMNTKLADCVSTTYLPRPSTTEYIGGKKK